MCQRCLKILRFTIIFYDIRAYGGIVTAPRASRWSKKIAMVKRYETSLPGDLEYETILCLLQSAVYRISDQGFQQNVHQNVVSESLKAT